MTTETPDKKKPVLTEWRKEYEQDGDCCGGDSYQHLTVECLDGGGGQFFVIATERWAFNSLDELLGMLREAGCA